jgi:HPt (histidine-containing phosphotransfer) domain-containing protein
MSSSQPARPSDAGTGWSVDDLRAVWTRQHRQVNERIGVLESALAALADNRLEPDLRCEAERAAHTLAGSLGMFGFMGAADAARKLEQALASPQPQRSPRLSELLEQLQEGVEGPCGAPLGYRGLDPRWS